MQQRRRHRRHAAVAQGMYQGACLVHARVEPASHNQQQNTTFISIHACKRVNDIGDTLQLHKACTKGRASSMPVHSWRHIINNKTLHLSPFHACSRGDDAGDTLQLCKACTKACALSMPVHSWRSIINNKI